MAADLVAYRHGLALILGALCALGPASAEAPAESGGPGRAPRRRRRRAPRASPPGPSRPRPTTSSRCRRSCGALQRMAGRGRGRRPRGRRRDRRDARRGASDRRAPAGEPRGAPHAGGRARGRRRRARDRRRPRLRRAAAAPRGPALRPGRPRRAARRPRGRGPAPPPVPAPLVSGTARVDGPTPPGIRPAAGSSPASARRRRRARRVLGRQGGDAAYDRLRDLVREGRAAGNSGDLYDNRDRGHSALPPERHPQVIPIRYGEAARASDVDYGLNDRILFDRPTFGNSSTALTAGPLLALAAARRADPPRRRRPLAALRGLCRRTRSTSTRATRT